MRGQNKGNVGLITNMLYLCVFFSAWVVFTGCQRDHINGNLTPQYPKAKPEVNHWTSTPTPLYSPPLEPKQHRQQEMTWDLSGLNILLDPGHGGKDPGAQGNHGPSEKMIVLDISIMLKEMLESSHASVSLTRTNDRFITLDHRALLAQNKRIDFMLSIHADAASNKNAEGITVLIGRNASKKSKRLADFIHESISKTKNLSARKTRTQQLRVLENHNKPAVLIECGFLSNALDIQRLSAHWYKKRLCRAIIQGIYQYSITVR